MKFTNISAIDCLKRVLDSELQQGKYAIISIKDTEKSGYKFTPSSYCTGVIEIVLNSILPIEETFNMHHAGKIINFLSNLHQRSSEILVHCHEGTHRSRIVANALDRLYHQTTVEGDKETEHIYNLLVTACRQPREERDNYVYWH